MLPVCRLTVRWQKGSIHSVETSALKACTKQPIWEFSFFEIVGRTSVPGEMWVSIPLLFSSTCKNARGQHPPRGRNMASKATELNWTGLNWNVMSWAASSFALCSLNYTLTSFSSVHSSDATVYFSLFLSLCTHVNISQKCIYVPPVA